MTDRMANGTQNAVFWEVWSKSKRFEVTMPGKKVLKTYGKPQVIIRGKFLRPASQNKTPLKIFCKYPLPKLISIPQNVTKKTL